MKNLSTIGRILYALPFAFFGINHFIHVDWFAAEYISFIPIGPFTVMLTGVLLIAASISIITKKFMKLSTLLLSALLLIFILSIHLPHLVSEIKAPVDDEQSTHIILSLMLMIKDISLMGGSLVIAGTSEN